MRAAVSSGQSVDRGLANLAGELAISHRQRPLATDQPAAVSGAILASLQPLEQGEQMQLQWVATPTAPASAEASSWRGLWELLGLAPRRGQAVRNDAKAAQAKRSTPIFQVAGRLGVVAARPERARQLLRGLSSAFHLANGPGVHLYRRRLPSRLSAWRLQRRAVTIVDYPCPLNARELAMLVGFPLGSPHLPGLQLGGCRPLAPSADIPSSGRVVARASFPGAERDLALSVTDSLAHLHVLGPTGTGKSTLLLNLIARDMQAGHGVVVIDPTGDLVSDALDRVPADRVEQVTVLDPTDDPVVGLNVLAAAHQRPELVVEQVVSLFHSLYRASWGPRTDDILRSALLTLVAAPMPVTLCEVPLLLTDPGFRRRLVSRLDEPIALEPFWGWYEGLSPAERAQAIGPVSNKLRAFLLRRRLRNVLGQAEPPLDFDRVLAEQRILLVSLPKGLLGEEAAALIGSLVVAQLWQAVQRRAALDPHDRHPVFAYIDEVQDFLHLENDVGNFLAQARKLGLGLTLAHQHLGQLSPALRQGVLANARSRVVFQLAAADAQVVAKEWAPHISAEDLRALGPREVVVALVTGARVAPPATAVTPPAPPVTGQGSVARAASRRRYGQDSAAVEAAIRARHAAGGDDGDLGRQPRRPS